MQEPPTYSSPSFDASFSPKSSTSQLEIGVPIGTLDSISDFKINGILLQSKYVQSPDTLTSKQNKEKNRNTLKYDNDAKRYNLGRYH